ncbi:DmsC/YnfH family molybdoenzyme membrane anchor subunit [Sulfurimonas sp.]|uniref:DmsC/YnfH family molybdoenzyme membrane anchor subunit n=1 Tax=Sulfurimonas sp. TaxID=2022749 RepID=UPI002AAF9CE8|nr:DmsC/YnfH family molybdoenzyme membrane anchor subunit [Sulfurimonas sp.]
MQTPLESFIDHKADTGMQCGNYSIDIPKLQEGEQYRFHFDATACIGCRCCEVACNEQNNNPADTKWRRVGEMEGGEFPAFTQLFNSMSCNHCIDPECLKGCPTSSYIKIEETGIVVHEDDTCIGCQYCTWNCPYGVPTFHEERKIVTKCHMCHERLDVGQTPACVQACPSGAIEIEVVNVQKWLDEDMAKEANMPFLPDANITKSTTRYTLPENLPTLKEIDEHILKPAHSELPLVFMTVLTQISIGGFFALFLGDILSLFGFAEPTFIMAIVVMLPAAIGLPLSALHLGRPFLALTAMKNIKTSWLSREALALGIFTALMNLIVILYFLDISQTMRLFVEFLTLIVGVFGIYSQSMIYRIKARPSWDRITTNLKFFGVSYIGAFLLAFVALILDFSSVALPLMSLGMMGAVAQIFFTYEDLRTLKSIKENKYQLLRTARLYDENFKKIMNFRFVCLFISGFFLPLIINVLLSSSIFLGASVVLGISIIMMTLSELSDRFLFYVTVVPLGMAGGFFVGKQR